MDLKTLRARQDSCPFTYRDIGSMLGCSYTTIAVVLSPKTHDTYVRIDRWRERLNRVYDAIDLIGPDAVEQFIEAHGPETLYDAGRSDLLSFADHAGDGHAHEGEPHLDA